MERELLELLRALYPGVSGYTEEELCYGRSVLGAMRVARHVDERPCRLPMRYIPVGGRVRVGVREYVCVLRPSVSSPQDACMGCAFRNGRPSCGDLQCGAWDRADGAWVWYARVKGAGDGE